MSLFFGTYKKSCGDKKVFSSESRGVSDFPQDCSADTHDRGTRLDDGSKPADVSAPKRQCGRSADSLHQCQLAQDVLSSLTKDPWHKSY